MFLIDGEFYDLKYHHEKLTNHLEKVAQIEIYENAFAFGDLY